MVKSVGVRMAGLYSIFRSQLLISEKLTAVIVTIADVAVVLIVPSVAIGAFWALRFMAIPIISIEKKVVKYFIV
jgi:hypothetical protein